MSLYLASLPIRTLALTGKILGNKKTATYRFVTVSAMFGGLQGPNDLYQLSLDIIPHQHI